MSHICGVYSSKPAEVSILKYIHSAKKINIHSTATFLIYINSQLNGHYVISLSVYSANFGHTGLPVRTWINGVIPLKPRE